MTFAVGRIRKCTLKLKLLVFLFCSPEVGLSYHVKCGDRLAPPPNLRVSENRSIVHFETRVETLLIRKDVICPNDKHSAQGATRQSVICEEATSNDQHAGRPASSRLGELANTRLQGWSLGGHSERSLSLSPTHHAGNSIRGVVFSC